MLKPKDVARFWAGVDRNAPEPDNCWLWVRWRDPGGYGRMGIAGTMVTIHRIAWEIAFGPIPPGKHVLHRCDVRHCARPSHLFLGRNRDNVDDRVAKRRSAHLRGSLNGNARLSESQVATIKDRYAAGGITLTRLASEYGVSFSLIGKIVTGKMWAHVGEVVSHSARGKRVTYRSLTDPEVREIRAALARGEKGIRLAETYGCSRSTISLISRGKRWRSVT